jgi:hypothetical protein
MVVHRLSKENGDEPDRKSGRRWREKRKNKQGQACPRRSKQTKLAHRRQHGNKLISKARVDKSEHDGPSQQGKRGADETKAKRQEGREG